MDAKKKKIIIIAVVAVIAIIGIILAIVISGSGKQEETSGEVSQQEDRSAELARDKNVKIFSGEDRPIAVMIDNHNGAWPQGGLNKAYMVYEIIVEGGETRLMALFKGQDVEKIGPVRSSRHYFIDYAMENDAIYVHYGWSPQAKKDISKYGVNNINGITEGADTFWRVSDKAAPHNAVTNTQKILASAQSKGYKTTSDKKSVLKYTTEEVELENGVAANKVYIPHSNLQNVTYEYDETNKVYKRSARGRAQTDWNTGENVTTKNIIITFCNNETIGGDAKGRQTLHNKGTFDGYYITNGKAIKIKCKKEASDKQTVYEDLDGKEIKVNDGNTFVNICPIGAAVTIE